MRKREINLFLIIQNQIISHKIRSFAQKNLSSKTRFSLYSQKRHKDLHQMSCSVTEMTLHCDIFQIHFMKETVFLYRTTPSVNPTKVNNNQRLYLSVSLRVHISPYASRICKLTKKRRIPEKKKLMTDYFSMTISLFFNSFPSSHYSLLVLGIFSMVII